jgi:tetratricopeptide (TPR) repeat protein
MGNLPVSSVGSGSGTPPSAPAKPLLNIELAEPRKAADNILGIIDSEADREPQQRKLVIDLPKYFNGLSATSNGKARALAVIGELKQSPADLVYFLFELARGRPINVSLRDLLQAAVSGSGLARVRALSPEKILAFILGIGKPCPGYQSCSVFKADALVQKTYNVAGHKIRFINFDLFDPPASSVRIQPPNNLNDYLFSNVFHKSMQEYKLDQGNADKALSALRTAARHFGFGEIDALSPRQAIVVTSKAARALLGEYNGQAYAEGLNARIKMGGGVCHDYSEIFVALFLLLKESAPQLVNVYPNTFNGGVTVKGAYFGSGHAWDSLVVIDNGRIFGTLVDPTWSHEDSVRNALDREHSGILNDMQYYINIRQEKRMREAGETFLALNAGSKDPEKMLLFSEINEMLGNQAARIENLKNILLIAPNHQLAPFALERLGDAYYFEGHDKDTAFVYYKQLTDRFSNSSCCAPRAWGFVGDYLENKGNLREAIGAFKKVCLLSPDWHGEHALYHLGGIYAEKAHDYSAAVDSYLKFLRLYPKSYLVRGVYFHLGDLYSQHLNEPEKARHYYSLVLKSHPDTIDRERAQKNIEALPIKQSSD